MQQKKRKTARSYQVVLETSRGKRIFFSWLQIQINTASWLQQQSASTGVAIQCWSMKKLLPIK